MQFMNRGVGEQSHFIREEEKVVYWEAYHHYMMEGASMERVVTLIRVRLFFNPGYYST